MVSDEQSVYVSVRATNMAGMQTTVVASGLVIDTSPPVAGFVHDGPPSVDRDFQVVEVIFFYFYFWPFSCSPLLFKRSLVVANA